MLVFKVAEVCSKLPFSKIYLATPDFWLVIAYYIAITGIVYFFNSHKFKVLRFILGDGTSSFVKKYWQKIVAGAVAICLVINVIGLIPRNLRIYFVDVGQRRLHCDKKSDGQKYHY